jgi:hypothetical protein
MATHNTKLSLTVFIDQPDSVSGFIFGSPKQFVSSSAGAVDGSTIVSTTLNPTTSDMFVGYWVECIDDPTNKGNIGLRRRISSVVAATDTLTVDKFPYQVSSAATFWLLIPQHVWMAEDTGSSAIAVKDATRNEANDYWNGTAQEGGPRIETISATTVPKTSTYLVTDFVQTAGVASATLGANTAVGDLYEIWQHLEPSDVTFDLTQENIDRPIQGVYESDTQIRSNRSGSGNLVLPFRGPGNGRAGSASECHRVMKCVLDATSNSDLTVDNGSSTSSVAYSSGTAVVGKMYLTQEGDAFMCTVAGSPATPSPTLEYAPTNDSTITGMYTYTPSTDINYALAAKRYQGDGIIEYILGIAPDFKVSGELNQPLKLEYPLQVTDWARIVNEAAGQHTRAWNATRSTISPVALRGIRLKVDNTSYSCKSFNFALNTDLQRKGNLNAPNGSDGYQAVGYNPTGQIVAYVDSSTIASVDDFLGSVQRTCLIQCGTKGGFPGCFALYLTKMSYSNVSISDDSGLLTVTIDYKLDRSAVTGLPQLAIGVA